MAGVFDDDALAIILNVHAYAVGKSKRVHFLMQSDGGVIPSGIAVYNILRHSKLDLTTYNCGRVDSIGVIAYLSGKTRVASNNASFMIHKAYARFGGNAITLAELARITTKNDERIESILREHITLTPDKREVHKHTDLIIAADEAKDCGLATKIADFSPPLGAEVMNIIPPKK